jgi:hypothetical protein
LIAWNGLLWAHNFEFEFVKFELVDCFKETLIFIFIFILFELVDCLSGDFVVGNRPLFYELLLPNVRQSARIPNSGHLVMYDQPVILANHIAQFIADN